MGERLVRAEVAVNCDRSGPKARAVACAMLAAALGCATPWPQIEQPGAGFRVALPASATCGSERKVTPLGEMSGHDCTAELDRSFFDRLFPIRFHVAWSDVPPALDLRDAAAVESFLDSVATSELPKGTTTARRPSTLGGAGATEFDSSMTMNDAFHSAYSLRERLALRGRRLYRVGVTGAMGPTSERAWERLLASFQFAPSER